MQIDQEQQYYFQKNIEFKVITLYFFKIKKYYIYIEINLLF